MKVSLVSLTDPAPGLKAMGIDTAESLIVYCARVSSPQNQLNTGTGEKLLRYCIDNSHWSVFEMAHMTVEIETSRAVSAQICRHRSFSFQEFSQRYATVDNISDDMFQPVEIRTKNPSGNRQGSVEGEDPALSGLWHGFTSSEAVKGVQLYLRATYKRFIEAGVAPECARMVLPLCTTTRLYMTGSVRSWIHYLKIRTDSHTQKEHRQVANAISAIFALQFPITYSAAFEPKP